MARMRLFRYIPVKSGLLLAATFAIVCISWKQDVQRYVSRPRVAQIISGIQESSRGISGFLASPGIGKDEEAELMGMLNSSVTRCRATRRLEEGEICRPEGRGGWQCYENRTSVIYLLRAFYDDRPLIVIPHLRMIAVGARFDLGDTFCQVWYDGLDEPHVTRLGARITGHVRYLVGTVRVTQYLFSCVLPKIQARPTHVSIVTGRGPCGKATMFFPITHPEGKGKPFAHEFGLCVPISFGTIQTVPLIEWIEMYRILGVTEFNIYNCSVFRKPELGRVLDYYQAEGVLRLHELTPPSLTWKGRGHGLATPGSINDCMMTNIYRYRRTIIIDLDEVIVPKLDRNLTALLHRVDRWKKRSNWPGYYFTNIYFHKSFKHDESQPMYLRTMRLNRRFMNPGQAMGKSIIDSRTCMSAFNHYCLTPFSKALVGTAVKFSFAGSHHYRYCGGKTCPYRENHTVQDDSILKFKDELDTRVVRIMKLLDIKTPDRIV